MAISPHLRDWMLATDPALAWQVERDLLGEPDEVWQATRARVAIEGMGKRLLELQDADGQWAGGAYFPGGFDFHGPEAQPGAGQPWTATTWSLNTLRDWGLDARVLAGTAEKLAANSRWEYGDLPYWGGEVDCCINGFTLANGAWLGADVSTLPSWFLEHRLADGGWNCEWETGSTRSSFDSTLNSLKGILFWESVTGSDELRAARHGAEEYLLERHAMRGLRSGAVLGDWVTSLGYPFRWRYSVLNALEYFRAASRHDGAAPDPRLVDAVDALRASRQPDGSWLQQHHLPGRTWFELDVPVGEPSPWLTLFATRALDWWNGSTPA